MTEARSTAWISPPGDTINDVLGDRGWTRSELAKRLGCSAKHVSELLRGAASITAETAAALALVLGSTTDFWLRREANYRAALQRKEEADALAAEAAWLDELPVRWLVANRHIPDRAHKGERVRDTLQFFGTASVAAYRETYLSGRVAFRSSSSFGKRPGAVASWIRLAEIAADDIPTAPWNETGLRNALPGFRALTTEPDPARFVLELTRACAAVGVVVAFVPAPPGCPASGCTRWLTPNRALLVLSLRHRTNDHLWFTFFHEAAHLLLHSKKTAFLEGLDGLDPALEDEANVFARDLLIPQTHQSGLGRLVSESAVRAFADEIGVHPGIVVGRMQHDGNLAHTQLNHLKVRYTWASETESGDE